MGLDLTIGPAFITRTLSFFQESQWNELLETLHRLPIPDPGVSVHLSVVSGASSRQAQVWDSSFL